MRLLAAFSSTLLVFPCYAFADTFGSGANVLDIEFVPIGNPGNPDDTTGKPNPAGAVAHDYRIAKYEISRDMIEKVVAASGLEMHLQDMTHYGGNGPNQPATGMNWYQAAKFVNWLNADSGYPDAYKFDGDSYLLWQPEDAGYAAANPFRNSLAQYFLPSTSEWYKAAYYDPQAGAYNDYPTGGNAKPTSVASGTIPGTAVVALGFSNVGPAEISQAGGLSPYGTMAQGGNVQEWQESEYDAGNVTASAFRAVRGGAWYTSDSSPHASLWSLGSPETSSFDRGFRVASLPMSTMTLSADFDGDNDVDGYDFLKWQRGESPVPLTASDLMLWEDEFGVSVVVPASEASAVPESTSGALALMAIAAACWIQRRKSSTI